MRSSYDDKAHNIVSNSKEKIPKEKSNIPTHKRYSSVSNNFQSDINVFDRNKKSVQSVIFETSVEKEHKTPKNALSDEEIQMQLVQTIGELELISQ